MNKFEFMLNLDRYRKYRPKNVLYHDSYDIPKKEIHKIQPEYSKAPKIYKDQISLYEEYNEEFMAHRGDMKFYQKIENFYGPGSHRYFYSKEEWDAYQDEKNKMYDKAREAQAGRDAAIKNSQKNNYRRISEGKDGKITLHDDDTGASKKLNVNSDQFWNGVTMDDDIAIERSLKDGGIKAGVNAILRDERMEEFFTQFEGGFENHGWELNDDGTISGMSDEDKKYIKKMGDWMRKFKDSEGNSLYDSKEFQDRVMSEIKNRYKIAQEYKNDPDREKKDAEEDAYWEEENKKAGERMNKALKTVRKEEKIKRIEKKLNKLGEGGNTDLTNLPDVPVKKLAEAGWDNVGTGKVKTYTSTFTSDIDGACYNFSPIIVDQKTGKLLGIMSPKEFEEYCLDVVNGDRKDDYNLQIGGAFRGEDAVDKAVAACEEIDRLHNKLDKTKSK